MEQKFTDQKIYRKKCFLLDYGSELNKFDKNRKKYKYVYQQVYEFNKFMYRELDICRDIGILPCESKCFQTLIEEGRHRFTRYNYIFNGRIFVKDKKG